MLYSTSLREHDSKIVCVHDMHNPVCKIFSDFRPKFFGNGLELPAKNPAIL